MALTLTGDGDITGLAVGALPPNVIGAGAVLQVVSTTFTSEFSWTTKGSWVDMTGISVSITPSSASSKILIKVMLSTGDGGNNFERAYRVTRNGTNIVEGPNTGSIMARASFATGMGAFASNAVIMTIPYLYLDTPESTSALTYQVQGYASTSSSTTSYINRPYSPTSSASSTGISTITVMEIAG